MALTASERKDARTHLLRLAKRHGIQVVWRSRLHWSEYECHPSTKIVFVAKPRTIMDYLACLHEFGHLLCPHADLARDYGHLIMEEAAAWLWAVEHLPLRKRLKKWHYATLGWAWASHIQARW